VTRGEHKTSDTTDEEKCVSFLRTMMHKGYFDAEDEERIEKIIKQTLTTLKKFSW